MTKRRSGSTAFLVGVALTTGVAYGVGSYLRSSNSKHFIIHPTTQLAQASAPGDLALLHPLKGDRNTPTSAPDSEGARKTFATVYQLVRQYYVDKLPDEGKLSYGAIKSMVSSLNDPNCYFLEPGQYQLLESESAGRFAGIGAALSVQPFKHDGYTEYKVVVVSALPGSPAETAGMKSGDVITHIDGKWILGFDPYLKANKMVKAYEERNDESSAEAVEKEVQSARKRAAGGIGLFSAQMALRGDAKTLTQQKLAVNTRVLTVERLGTKAPLKLTVPMGTTEVAGVSTRTLNDTTTYIRIPLFTDKTANDVTEALAGIPVGNNVVLDLRGNPGGQLEAAMRVQALLSGNAPFGYEVTTGAKQIKLAPANAPASSPRRVAVLVDHGTASVAEALAAALTDAGTSGTVGDKTFGDATAQTLFPLPDGSAFVLTTGRMLNPHRGEWANIGLSPRVTVAPGTQEQQILDSAVDFLKSKIQVARGLPGEVVH